METTRPYYTIAEAARLLKVNPSTIWRWIETKQLPAFRIGQRGIRIRPEDLETVVEPLPSTEYVPASKRPVRTLEELLVPPTPEQLARRRAAVDRALAHRAEL